MILIHINYDLMFWNAIFQPIWKVGYNLFLTVQNLTQYNFYL